MTNEIAVGSRSANHDRGLARAQAPPTGPVSFHGAVNINIVFFLFKKRRSLSERGSYSLFLLSDSEKISRKSIYFSQSNGRLGEGNVVAAALPKVV